MKQDMGRGIITPIVTPIRQDESVNYEQLGKVLDHLVAGGVNAVFVMGSTGEFARFSAEVRDKVIAETVRMTAGRKPVYAGVGDTGLANTLRNLKTAEAAGADIMVVTLPYYYPIRNDDEAYSFFAAVSDATDKPVMLYNIPSTCGASISLAVIERLFSRKNIIGIKDSSGDKARLEEEVRRFKNRERDFAVTIGSEELAYEGLKMGADGLVPSLANPFPALFADLYATAVQKDFTKLRKLCDVVDAMNRLNDFCDAWMSPNVWRKKALSLMGICDEWCTRPYVPMPAADEEKVRGAIRQYREMYG